MKAHVRINVWLWVLLCVPCLLASCDHDVHDAARESGLSVSLAWADQADRGTEVNDVRLWLFNADTGSLVGQRRCGSAKEAASQRFQLPEGNYRILSCVNLTEPFTINEATDFSVWNGAKIGLTYCNNVSHNAYFGVAEVTIADKGKNYVATVPVKSVLAELTIVIGNVPEGTKMTGKVTDAARCLFPTLTSGDNGYGLPSAEAVEVDFPNLSAVERTIQSETIRLMPTVQGGSASHIYLCLTLADDTPQEFDITAPAMKTGGKYELRLDYNQMQPKMNLEATVNNWNDLTDEVEIK